MEIEAGKVIEKLKLLVAEQAQQLAVMQVMIDELQKTKEEDNS